MEKYAHATIGATGWLYVAAPAYEHFGRNLTPNELIFGMIVAAGAACFADFDTIESAACNCLGRLTRAFHHVLKPIVGGHRQGTHSVWGVIIATLLAVAASAAGAVSVFFPLAVVFFPLAIFFRLCFGKVGPWPMTAAMAAGTSIWMLTNTVDTGWIPFAFAIGYVLHIVADMFTVQGVQPFYGFPIKAIAGITAKIPLFRSGGAAEKPLTWIVAGAGAFLLATGTFLPQLAELQARERGQAPTVVAAAPSAKAEPSATGVKDSARAGAGLAQRGAAAAREKASPTAEWVALPGGGTRETLTSVAWREAIPIPRCKPSSGAGLTRVAHPALTCGKSVMVCTESGCTSGVVVARSRRAQIAAQGVKANQVATVHCPTCRPGDVVV